MSIAHPQPIPDQALAAVAALRAVLGDDLVAVWLYGSFVDGGLRPASDIDLLALLRRPLDDDRRTRLMAGLLALSSPPGRPARRALEVTCVVQADIQPWRHPALRELQFGEWLRADLEAGTSAGREHDPDLAVLLTQARGKGIALYGPDAPALLPVVPAADVRDAIMAMLPGVAANLAGEEGHALLAIARMWVTLETGAIVPKDTAAAIGAPRLPPEHRQVLERARDVYLGAAADDWTHWQPRVAACVRHMVAELARFRSE